ncbi:uncharacterized protein [Medicago truncatula]|uniref:uncharacterized protein n=1 Tax=Medicago truncatula TaxID=3880 RepID=UPI000D2F1939|nr:uncharacterized protein LOC112422062 [Medicago truncatula]
MGLGGRFSRECYGLFANVTLQASQSDEWRWRLDNSGKYYVCSVYDMLTTGGNSTVDEASNLVWHKHVPLKVSILAWRLLRNRLPTKTNLAVRGILVQDAHLCVSGCGEVETVQHSFVSCHIFRDLWQYVRAWIGVTGVDPFDAADHFV